MSKGIFITATGTDIGKTYVTALLAKKMKENGKSVGYYKAALSGADIMNESLVPGDCKYVADVSGMEESPESLVSYIYETAVSPHLASRMEKKPIELSVIRRDFEAAAGRYDYILMEGSGGIICPLQLEEGNKLMLADLIKEFNLEILLVASSELGTINHVILTVEYARSQNIGIRGIILNNYEENNFLHQDNKASIEQLTGLPVVSCIGTGDIDCRMDIETLCSLFTELG